METETITLREGDIYRWAYRDSMGDMGQTYHCCSRIAVVGKSGRLRDTFWSSGGDGRNFGIEDLPKLELTFIANFSDLERAHDYEADYYDDADIVNLNHSNSGRNNFYLRKGAKRSQQKMLASAKRKLEREESVIRTATWRVEQIRKSIERVEGGNTTSYI